jgi:hypothetical protein
MAWARASMPLAEGAQNCAVRRVQDHTHSPPHGVAVSLCVRADAIAVVEFVATIGHQHVAKRDALIDRQAVPTAGEADPFHSPPLVRYAGRASFVAGAGLGFGGGGAGRTGIEAGTRIGVSAGRLPLAIMASARNAAAVLVRIRIYMRAWRPSSRDKVSAFKRPGLAGRSNGQPGRLD